MDVLSHDLKYTKASKQVLIKHVEFGALDLEDSKPAPQKVVQQYISKK